MDDLAIITCLFSPNLSLRRRANYTACRAQFGTNLFVAELSFATDEANEHLAPNGYSLRGDAEHLMWQKERMLNWLLAKLPSHIKYVAWVDADVLFLDKEWKARAKVLLQKYPVIQLFDRVTHLGPDGFPEWQGEGAILHAADRRLSATGVPLEQMGATGFAWAARRDVLQEIGLMDFMVVGGADCYMAYAFLGEVPSFALKHFSPALQEAIRQWAKRASHIIAGRISYLPGTIEHLYHGPLQSRRYYERYRLLREASFDPAKDIALDSMGIYKWSSSKPMFHAKVADYFAKRGVVEDA